MKLQILELARDDLIEGYHFYEDKEDGLEEDVVRIRAIVDCRRKPSWVRLHLERA